MPRLHLLPAVLYSPKMHVARPRKGDRLPAQRAQYLKLRRDDYTRDPISVYPAARLMEPANTAEDAVLPVAAAAAPAGVPEEEAQLEHVGNDGKDGKNGRYGRGLRQKMQLRGKRRAEEKVAK
jgi:hypothetical protein